MSYFFLFASDFPVLTKQSVIGSININKYEVEKKTQTKLFTRSFRSPTCNEIEITFIN